MVLSVIAIINSKEFQGEFMIFQRKTKVKIRSSFSKKKDAQIPLLSQNVQVYQVIRRFGFYRLLVAPWDPLGTHWI